MLSSAYAIAVFRMRNDLLLHAFATAAFLVRAWSRLNELVATAVLVDELGAHGVGAFPQSPWCVEEYC